MSKIWLNRSRSKKSEYGFIISLINTGHIFSPFYIFGGNIIGGAVLSVWWSTREEKKTKIIKGEGRLLASRLNTEF